MVSAEAVVSRIKGSKRPLLTDGVSTWAEILESRRAIYERLATRTWDTSSRPLDAIANEIADWAQNGN
jgi:shikimate kinase